MKAKPMTSTPTQPRILKAILNATHGIAVATNGKSRMSDFRLLISNDTAQEWADTDEVKNYVKNSPLPLPAFPDSLYGVQTVIADVATPRIEWGEHSRDVSP